MKRRQKAGFLSPRSFKITVTKEKKGENERARRRKDGEEKKAMVALLVFIIATSFGDSFWPKTLLDAKGPFGDNIFKTPARHNVDIHAYIRSTSSSSTGNPSWSVSCEAW